MHQYISIHQKPHEEKLSRLKIVKTTRNCTSDCFTTLHRTGRRKHLFQGSFFFLWPTLDKSRRKSKGINSRFSYCEPLNWYHQMCRDIINLFLFFSSSSSPSRLSHDMSNQHSETQCTTHDTHMKHSETGRYLQLHRTARITSQTNNIIAIRHLHLAPLGYA